MRAPSQPPPSPRRPPALADFLLRLFVPAEDQAEVLGDPKEAFAARTERYGTRRTRLWYWSQVARFIPRMTTARGLALAALTWPGPGDVT